ncbi:MAG TPA: glycoside hydrolase family 9 protein [Candidatus Sulfotelmatobacter sp.]|nr:glycoside hydrolase family 9 protein [Candidatus Sulfotelmatobacter sp.]
MALPIGKSNASILSHVFLTILCVFATAGLSNAASAYIRVNQVGYASGATKRAYLMSTAAETGATFAVKNSGGTTVYSALVGASLGAWGTFTSVYALDFDSVSTAGTYTVAVASPVAATSPSFEIDTAANLYATSLANSLFYYETSRDGANYIPNSLRTAPAHLNDQSATAYLNPTFDRKDNAGALTATGAVLDASGGWWDAGDYLKFVETHSYTVGMMLVGVRDFPGQMGSGSSTSNFTAEARFGLDWLQKMWVDSSKTLYYQVSVASGGRKYTGDHDIWRLPQADDNYQGCVSPYQFICHRPVLQNPAGGAGASISPNLAGRLAASFALCYKVFAASDTAYANQCLLSAEHIFDLANTAPTGNLATAGPFDFYPETEWRDDLEWGATELYFALQGASNLPSGLPHTDPMFYLPKAATWANAYITGPNDAADTLNLYDVSGLAHYELYRAIALAGNPSGLATSQAALLADLKKQLDKAVTQAGTDRFGFGFPWNTYDTTSHGGGLVVMANEYDYLTSSTAYAAYGNRWQANVLGANAWGVSLIVGDGTTFPLCMQHQVTNLVAVPPNGPPFLLGAAVEGPNSAATKGSLTGMVPCPPNGVDTYAAFNGNGAVFKDNVQSYSTVEPAIDLTASSFLGFSWLVAGAPSGTP